MKRRTDDMSFENAWEKQYADESKGAPAKGPKEVDDVKVHHPPAFRGQRDTVEKRDQFKMPKRRAPIQEKKQVKVVDQPSSKEGDDFDVEW
mgnify:FL=1